MTREQRLRFNSLEARYPEIFKTVGTWTLRELKSKFVKKGKFVRFINDSFSQHKLSNFNIAVAEIAHKEKWLSETERKKQNSVYAFRISSWTQKTLKKHGVICLGDAIEKCIDKNGSFKPLGGKYKAVSANYQIASIIRKTGFLSEKAFQQVQRPSWKYRRLTEEELGEAKDIVINVTTWPEDTRKIINVLHKRRHNLSWDRYQSPVPEVKSVTMEFLAGEFLRIPSDDDMPVFKTKGHRLNRAFALTWTDKDLEQALEVVKSTLRDNYLLP